MDDSGSPIKNDKGEFKVKNSAERVFRFVDKFDFTIPKNDEKKMNLLFTALKDVCKSNGVSIQAVDRDLLENGDKGCEGLYNYKDKRIQYASDLPLERRVSVLFHELTHVLLHSNLKWLSTEMGIDKKEINRKLEEIQAEATAYLTAKKFGIETDTASFHYLAAFSHSLDLREFEKSLTVIHKASNSILSFIEKDLIKSGFNLLLEPVSVTDMSKEQHNMYASRYLEDAVIQRSAEYADVLQNLVRDYEKVTPAEKENIEDQIRCVSKIDDEISEVKGLLRRLSNVNIDDKAGIIGIVERLDSLLSSIHRNEAKFTYLVDEHFSILNENDNLVSLFSKDPMKAIGRLGNAFTEFEGLSKPEMEYIASSKVILDDYSYLLRNERDMRQFVSAAVQRAYYIEDISAKNGVFIEINSMENFDPYNRPVLVRGELCHPKYADTVIQEAEQTIRRLKATAKERNEYYPYSVCDLTIYSPKPDGGLNALQTRIDIGDKGQTGLTDHLRQCCKDGRLKEILKAYETAFLDRIWDFHAIPKIPASEDLRDNRIHHEDDISKDNAALHYEHNIAGKKNTIARHNAKSDIGEGA